VSSKQFYRLEGIAQRLKVVQLYACWL